MYRRPKYNSAKTIKLLGENIGVNLGDLRLGNDFLDMTPKPQATTTKIGKLDCTKIINFCPSEDTTTKVERQSTDWEKNTC